MGKGKKNRGKSKKEYKQHSKGRYKYKSVKDWPDPEEYDDNYTGNVVPLRKPRQSKRQRRAAKYHAALEEIVFLELGGYYWSGVQQEELHDDANIDTRR